MASDVTTFIQNENRATYITGKVGNDIKFYLDFFFWQARNDKTVKVTCIQTPNNMTVKKESFLKSCGFFSFFFLTAKQQDWEFSK